MTDREQQPATGVPRLIDQYKQRRQAWLAQADELVRLRDEVRSAAEREALEIVTAARRDVRRIVVEARRELLVLTAQLHAAIDSVDQASLQAASEAGAEKPDHVVAEVLSGQASLGATEDAVLVARREVRSVLDEARAGIEALVAQANGPLQEQPATGGTSPAGPEPPILTLDAILAADALSRPGVTVPQSSAPEPSPVIDAAGTVASNEQRVPDPAPSAWYEELEAEPRLFGPGPSSSGAVAMTATEAAPAAVQTVEDAVSFIVTAPDPPLRFSSLRAAEEPVADTLAHWVESGPAKVGQHGRGFLAEYEDGARSRPAWMWVGLFAATGIVALVGTVWWFTLRDSSAALATSVERTDPRPVAAAAPAAGPVAAATASPASGPSGLAVEVRRTAWIRAVVDGKEDSRVYQAGETRQIVGAKTVSLRAGDGGAVFVSLDGRPAEPLGPAGRAVTKQYSLAGSAAAAAPAVATAPTAGEASVEPLAAVPPPAAPAAGLEPAVSPGNPAARPQLETSRTNQPTANPPATAAGLPSSAAAPAGAEATPAAPPPASGGRADLIAAGQQWLDAYQRRDRDAMSSSGTENMTISDERSVTERFPAWQTGVRRDLDQLELELSGDTALLTARMTERSGDAGNASAQHVSRVSQIWVRRGGRWRLADVRIIGEARLNQIVR